MNQIEIGKLITKARKEKGYTQKQLADFLFVTDKAVSKWERGLSLPDLNSINKLASIIDIDIEEIIPTSALDSEWVGIINTNEDDEIYKKTICGQTVFEYLVSYFLLFGIHQIYINCSDEKFIECLNLSKFGISVYLNDVMPNKKRVVVSDNIILVGANLTRKFKNFMSLGSNVKLVHNNQDVPITIEGYNEEASKALGNGYICVIVDKKNFDEVSSFINFFNKNNNFKLGNLSEIKINRLK